MVCIILCRSFHIETWASFVSLRCILFKCPVPLTTPSGLKIYPISAALSPGANDHIVHDFGSPVEINDWTGLICILHRYLSQSRYNLRFVCWNNKPKCFCTLTNSTSQFLPEKYTANPSGKSSGSSGFSTTTIVLIVVPCAIAVFIFATVLGIYIVRHRRLERSFLSFANSHYDTRSGTTTFSGGDDLGMGPFTLCESERDSEFFFVFFRYSILMAHWISAETIWKLRRFLPV